MDWKYQNNGTIYSVAAIQSWRLMMRLMFWTGRQEGEDNFFPRSLQIKQSSSLLDHNDTVLCIFPLKKYTHIVAKPSNDNA